MEVEIKTTDGEKKQLLKTVAYLESIPHIKCMPQRLLAEQSGLKETKVRAVLTDLKTLELIEVIKITDKPKYPRYYYHVTLLGHAFCTEEK
jgi:transcription initiation factor IIE alpha subunit